MSALSQHNRSNATEMGSGNLSDVRIVGNHVTDHIVNFVFNTVLIKI